jgi:hypothetical protein
MRFAADPNLRIRNRLLRYRYNHKDWLGRRNQVLLEDVDDRAILNWRYEALMRKITLSVASGTLVTAAAIVNFSGHSVRAAQIFDGATIEACAKLGTEIKKFSFLRDEAAMREIEGRLQSANLITASDIVNVKDQKTVIGMTMCGVIASRGLPFEVGVVNGRQDQPLYVLSYLRLRTGGRNDNFTIRDGKVIGWDAQTGFDGSGNPTFNRTGFVHHGPVHQIIYRYSLIR